MRDQILMMGIDQMIQDRGLRPSCRADALREISRTKLRKSLSDLTGPGSHSIIQLKGGFVISPEIRREQKQIHSKIQLMRQSPCGDFANVVEAGHTDTRCNPAARAVFAISGEILMARQIDNAETAHRDVLIDRSFCHCDTKSGGRHAPARGAAECHWLAPRSGRSSSASVLTTEGYQLTARSDFATRSQ